MESGGLLTETGEEIVAYKFDGAKDFKEGVAVVRMGNTYGFINTKGKIAIPLKYEQAETFPKRLGSCYAKRQKRNYQSKRRECRGLSL